jgi:hypothetical protein
LYAPRDPHSGAGTTTGTSMRTVETVATGQETYAAETTIAAPRPSIVRLEVLAVIGLAVIVIMVVLLRRRKT